MDREQIESLFVDFFKYDKGYTNWTEDEIFNSINCDDIDEFVDKIKEELEYKNLKSLNQKILKRRLLL